MSKFNLTTIDRNSPADINVVGDNFTKLDNGAQTAGDVASVVNPVQTDITTHKNNSSNPHGVTAAQAGAIPTTSRGAANGVASLNENTKIPTAQLPVDTAFGIAGLDANNRVNPYRLPLVLGSAAATGFSGRGVVVSSYGNSVSSGTSLLSVIGIGTQFVGSIEIISSGDVNMSTTSPSGSIASKNYLKIFIEPYGGIIGCLSILAAGESPVYNSSRNGASISNTTLSIPSRYMITAHGYTGS